MNILKKVFPIVLILAIFLTACGAIAQSPTSADLFVVVGNNASRFTGTTNGDGLLLDQFAQENDVNLYVQIANDREINDFREQMLAGQEGSPDILIVDDSLQADKLQKVKYIASHKVGSAIRSDVVDSIGLQGNTISYTDFVSLLKSGQISTTASNALAGADSAEFFFSTSAWCSNTDASNLTASILQLDYVRTCGKDVYDFIKSTNGSNAAIDLVYNTAVSGDQNGYNTIITFDSALLGDNGLNIKLIKESKPTFKFFYFKEATAQANVAIGTKDLTNNQSKSDAASLLISYLLNENSQNIINLAGFSEGSSALVRHNDTAFKSEWGVASNPVGVQIVNPPLSNVADNALLIYRDFYKREKVIYFIYDTSDSMRTQDINGGDGNYIVRLQALARAVKTFTSKDWQSQNGVNLGPNDKTKHFLFSTVVSPLIVETIGPNTEEAGNKIVDLIGPANGDYSFDDAKNRTIDYIFNTFNQAPYEFQSTAMFDAANMALEDVLKNYNPNVDYYFVILTDGKKTIGSEGVVYSYSGMLNPNADSFYKNWLEASKQNISLIGIQFGNEGGDLDQKLVTSKMNGATYNGLNDQDLINAFKSILGN